MKRTDTSGTVLASEWLEMRAWGRVVEVTVARTTIRVLTMTPRSGSTPGAWHPIKGGQRSCQRRRGNKAPRREQPSDSGHFAGRFLHINCICIKVNTLTLYYCHHISNLWNFLPLKLRPLPLHPYSNTYSLEIFLSRLKIHLFRVAYVSIETHGYLILVESY